MPFPLCDNFTISIDLQNPYIPFFRRLGEEFLIFCAFIKFGRSWLAIISLTISIIVLSRYCCMLHACLISSWCACMSNLLGFGCDTDCVLCRHQHVDVVPGALAIMYSLQLPGTFEWWWWGRRRRRSCKKSKTFSKYRSLLIVAPSIQQYSRRCANQSLIIYQARWVHHKQIIEGVASNPDVAIVIRPRPTINSEMKRI